MIWLNEIISRYNKLILSLIIVIMTYLIVSFYVFGGLLAYIIPALLWLISFMAVIFLAGGVERIKLWFYKPITIIALLTAGLQIVSLNFIGFFTEFGRSPYTFTPTGILINIMYFTAPILAHETSRAYIVKSFPKKRVYMGIAITTAIYTILKTPASKLLIQRSTTEAVKFMASEIIPSGAQSLLATYLALIGGPIASTAYIWTLEAYSWLAPILPNPPWAIKSLITALIPAIGLLMVNESLPTIKLVSHGIIGRGEIRRIRVRRSRIGKSMGLSTLIVILASLIIIWSATGLLGYQISVIASGSMRPTLEVGDIILTIQTPAEKIREGDIIHYIRAGLNTPIAHRVIETKRTGGTIIIVTKGDANNAPDEPILVTPTQKLWKVIFTIPKIGWVSIILKEAANTAITYLIENPTIAYISLSITASLAAIITHKHLNNPRRKIKRMLRT
ncbi:MAG: signal peptidase I [Ignisphaera sp.]